MADVITDNSFFLHQENTQIVPNPTYGRFQYRKELEEDNCSINSQTMMTTTALDYQTVSDYNPNYASNDDPSIVKAAGSNTIGSSYTAQQQFDNGDFSDQHVNGIPIPSHSNTQAIVSGSVPVKSSISVNTPDLHPVPSGSSLPEYNSACSPSTQLLPSSQASSGGVLYYNGNSQTSDTKSDDISSSMGSRISNTEPAKLTPRPSALGPKPQATTSQYSYAMQPFTRPSGRSVSESEAGVVVVPGGPSPIPETRRVPSLPPPSMSSIQEDGRHQTTSFASSNPLFVETNQNMSYGHHHRTLHHYHRDPTKMQDSSSTFDLILFIFSIVSIIISVVVIVLVIALVSRSNSSTVTTGGTTTVNPLESTNTSSSQQCDCSATADKKISDLQSKLQYMKSSLDTIRKVTSVISVISKISEDITSLNNQLSSLQESSTVRTSTTLDLLSNGCAWERKAKVCRSPSNYYSCTTPAYFVFENDMVMTDFYCLSRPSPHGTTTYIQTPLNGTGASIQTSLPFANEHLDQNTREQLKLTCQCFLALHQEDTETECDVYIKRCPIIRDTVPMVLRTHS